MVIVSTTGEPKLRSGLSTRSPSSGAPIQVTMIAMIGLPCSASGNGQWRGQAEVPISPTSSGASAR